MVATAPPGRFEELVAAAARAEAEAAGDPAGSASQPPPSAELREITPDRPLTSDPVSGEWAVASGLGGNVGPSGGAGRSVGAPSPGLASPQSDWDRLTGPSSGRRPVGAGDRGSWDIEEPDRSREPAAPAAAAPSESPSTMSLPHWTDPPTGEVPRILGDAPPPAAAAPGDDELSAWSALSTGPRWRDQPADWDEADFSDTVLDDREARLGALRDQPDVDDEGDLFAFDQAPAPVTPAPAAAARGRSTATQVRPPSRRARPGPPGTGWPARRPHGRRRRREAAAAAVAARATCPPAW